MPRQINLLLSVIFFSVIIISGSKLFKAENGIITIERNIEGTPIKIMKPEQSNGILVFIAHGFAGSSNFMRPIAVSLTQAGFTTIRFDFLGHGENTLPYSGSITQISGATKSFINQTNSVIDYYKNIYHPSSIILLGHSMASDIIFRTALTRSDITSVIGISTYTDVITSQKPTNILILNGEWEPTLKLKAYDILTKIGIAKPKENILYGSFDDGSARKIISIKNADHIGILFSKRTQEAIGEWMNETFKIDPTIEANQMGIWIAIIFISMFFCFFFYISSLPKKLNQHFDIPFKKFIFVNSCSLIFTPLILNFLKFEFVIFPAHNHLINHLFLYTCICLFCIPTNNLKTFFTNRSIPLFLALILVYGIFFGTALNSYVSTFIPMSGQRLSLLIMLLIGTIPYMIYLQILFNAKTYNWLMVVIAKIQLLCSLVISIALNFEELFLIGYAILLFLLFSIFFGSLSNKLSKRVYSQISVGFANAVMLAWAYSTALPLYIP